MNCFDEKYKLSFVDLSPVDTMKLMQQQQIDISISLDQKKLGESWECFYIGDLVWELMCRYNHPISGEIEVTELQNYPIAHSTFYDGQSVIQGEDFLKIPRKYKTHGHGIQNTFAAISMALSSDHLIYVPRLAAIKPVQSKKLRIIDIKHVEPTSNPIYLNVNIDRVSQKVLEKLINKLENFLAELTL